MPGLHLSLGIFNRLFTLLENACQELDLEYASQGGTVTTGGTSFQQYAKMLEELSHLKEQSVIKQQEKMLCSQLMSYLLVTVPSPEQSPTIANVRQELGKIEKQNSELVKLIQNCSTFTITITCRN